MCFSAEASFIASGVLTVIGATAVKKAKAPPQKAFAAIPLLFAAQQFTEGLLWVGLSGSHSAGWTDPAMYIFLIFA